MSNAPDSESPEKRSGINKGLVTSLLCLALSIAYMICARTYPNLAPDYLDVSAAFFPTVVAAVMIICSLSMLVRAIVRPERSEPLSAAAKKGYMRGAAAILTCLVYVLIFKPVGYIISSILAVFTMMLVFGNRRWLVMIIVSIVLPLALYAAFRYGLGVKLPDGILTFLK